MIIEIIEPGSSNFDHVHITNITCDMIKGVVLRIVRIVISPLHFVVLFAEDIAKVFLVCASLNWSMMVALTTTGH